MNMPGGRIVRVSLSEEIRQRLRERILSGELAPGSRLTEQGVAEDMGTSAGPVREAFASLTYEGLIISLPHRGTFVSEVSENEARAAYDIRARLDPYAGEQALLHGRDQLSAGLKRVLADMRQAAKAGDYAQMIGLDMQFHGLFYSAANNAILASVWPLLEGAIRKFMAVAGPEYNRDLNEIVLRHEELVALVDANDVRALRQALEEHGQDIWRRMPTQGPTTTGARGSRKSATTRSGNR